MEGNAFSDETLMAYADGELDAGTSRDVEAAAQADPEIARRIAGFKSSRALLGDVARARLEPVSADLEARVCETLRAARDDEKRPDTVVPFARAKARRATWWPMAAAASLALAVGLAGGAWLTGSDAGGAKGGLGVASFGPEMSQVLGTQPSGTRTAVEAGEIAMIASFVNADGDFCREFEFDRRNSETIVSVACRTDSGWQPRLAVVAAGTPDTGYAPASSLETLDAYLGAIGAGAPLSLEEEADAMQAGG